MGYKERITLQSDIHCRYCLENSSTGLIKACKCKGSLQYVHESCLLTWFQHKKELKCELCQENFLLKPNGLKKMKEWVLPEIEYDIIFWLLFVAFGLLIFLSCLVFYMASNRCSSYICLICYVFLPFITIYLAWMFVYLKFAVSEWSKYIRVNCTWKVIDYQDF